MANKATPDELARQEEDQEREFHRQVSAAKDETDMELMRDVWNDNQEDAPPRADEPENDGDHSLEDVEEDIAGGEPEDEQQEEEPAEEEQEDGGEDEEEGEEPETDRPQRDERSGRFVPSGRLREQTDRVEQLERELAEMRARMQQPQQPPQPPQPPPQKPDMFVDPDAHADWNMQRTLQAVRMQNAELSLAAAAEEYGDDYKYVYETLQAGVRRNDPAANQTVAQILGSANPGRALMRWGEGLLQDRQDQQEQAHREWLRDRYGIDAEELERREARSVGQQRQAIPPRRGMPSLNSAGGNGRVMQRDRMNAGNMNDSDDQIFRDVFEPVRR